MSDRERELGDVATRLVHENERVRIWEMVLEPGERSPVHEHRLDYILVFLSGDGIGVSDLAIAMSGNDLVVGIKDPASPAATFAQLTDRITLQSWVDALNRIETFQLGDGTVLNLAGIAGRLGTDAADTVTWTETAVSLDAGAGNDSITT